jgi:hypothetical protein
VAANWRGGRIRVNYDSLLLVENCLFCLEYQTLSKIGIGDGQKYLKKRFNSRKESCMYLSTCCLSHHMIDRVDAEIDEILRNEVWGELKVSI